MARSQNGWPTYSSGTHPDLVAIPDVAGRVRRGDVETIFLDFNRWFAANIEPIAEVPGQVNDDWGFANRAVTNGNDLSNHASGTAEDLNATRHPYKKRNTFTADQQAKIRARLRYYEGVLRWGGDYTVTKDDMHFEINSNAAAVARIAAKIRAGGGVAPVPSTRFADVPKNHPYYNQIEWAAVEKITTGWDNGNGTFSFRPDVFVTRAEAAVMLMRFSAKDEFKDVALNHPFALAIGWVQGASPAIARGFGDGTFRPDAVMARIDAAIWLWRHIGEPQIDKASGTFNDIGGLSADAISAASWLFQSGISKGWPVEGQSPEFRPSAGLTRADWVVFLNRLNTWRGRS